MRETFFRAVRAFQSGDLDTAYGICDGLLKEHPGQPDLLQLTGAILIERGDQDAGIAVLKRAAQEQSRVPDAWYNLGCAELKASRFDDAVGSFDRCLRLQPDHVSALNNRSTALLECGREDEAFKGYEQVVRLAPDHVGALHNLANLELRLGEATRAEALFRQAVSLSRSHAGALLGLGQALLAQHRYGDALGVLEKADQLVASAESSSALGRALNGVDRYSDALRALRRATELAPESADHWNNLGSTLTNMERVDEAEAALRKALEVEPDHEHALGNLAALLELSNRLEDCRALLADAEQRHVSSPALRVIDAKCLIRAEQVDDAVASLRALAGDDRSMEPALEKDLYFTLGQALDKRGDAAAAFEAFNRGNAVAADWWRRGNPRADQLLPAIEELSSRMTPEWLATWPDPGPADSTRRPPAFLVGFQRSGTTLLDTMLGAQGDVHVMEEQPVLNRVIDALEKSGRHYPGLLADLSASDWARARAQYWQSAGDLGGWSADQQGLLLDKSPLNLIHVGLIARLFPDAPVVLALRHPCDVCLSCLMQDFTLTPFMLHYTTIEGVARVYDRVMSLWTRYIQALEFRHHLIRYEDLVEDPESQLRGLLAFLDLPWRDEVLEHTKHARDRGVINTPSYHQVTQPVYRSARFRWHRYREQLAPVMPVLQPWIERFGYEG